MRRVFFLFLMIALLGGGLSACSSNPMGGSHADMKMAPMSDMPESVKMSSKTVQEAYQFAVANPDTLKQIPCYCGCGAMGHTSNYACYVQSAEGGKVTFDEHALGCSICVDITQDTMRLLKEGKSVKEIKAYVDQTYSKYGPSNIP
jgi:hypothetical protein